MAPPTTTPRRSTRLASATPSQPETARAPTLAQKKSAAAAFDPAPALSSILRGDRACLSRLTRDNLKDVANALADYALASDARIGSLESELQHARSQRGMGGLSRGQQSLKLKEIREKHAKSKAEASTQTADLLPPPPTEPARSPPPATPAAMVATTPAAATPNSIWGSFSKFFATPFSRKRAAEDDTDSPAPSQKRQKPTEPEPPSVEQPTTTPARRTSKQPSTTPAPRVIEPPATAPPASTYERPITTTPAPKRKRTNAAAVATPLPAIQESSPKPSMQTITPRPRTVASARAAHSARKAPKQPERRYAWEKKPEVKEPNADARIAKIREAENLRRKIAQLEAEEPLCRKVKRVKVDHLPEIPHNRPGDSEGTYRVPDVDSDDEIEVYDSVETRPNIFETPQPPAQQPTTPFPQAHQATTPAPPQSQQLPAQHLTTPLPPGQQATAPLPQPPQLPAQQITTPRSSAPTPAQQQIQAPQPAPPRFSFPSVAPRPADYSVTDEYKEACGNLFASGLAAF